ncbi:MAG TPA: hypothetical protein VGM44_21295 [Polyangiaceae bacterium]
MRVLCNAGSGALEYTHAFISAYAADHFRGAVAQRLSVGADECALRCENEEPEM